MAQVYKFQITMPVTTIMPRDRIGNTIHMQHVTGGLLGTDLESICQDLAGMYATRYHNGSGEIQVKCYDISAPPNLPLASVTVNAGTVWTTVHPHEVALCLSFAGDNRGDRRGRGRIYLMPGLDHVAITSISERPGPTHLQWALDFYEDPNGSFPDIGGIDWKFGIYSRVAAQFTQSTQAWVDDEWDTQRRRGMRETTRLSISRDG